MDEVGNVYLDFDEYKIVDMTNFIVSMGFEKSQSAARRAIDHGALKVYSDNSGEWEEPKWTIPDFIQPLDTNKRWVYLKDVIDKPMRLGKRNHFKIVRDDSN